MIVIDEDGEHIEIDASEHGNNKVFIAGDNKNALFIKDGKEVSKEDIMNLNPSDIDSVTVLKGDAATEKYGKKAKDGVVIIKTKKN